MSSYGIIEIYADHICINKGFVQVSPDLKCQFIYTLCSCFSVCDMIFSKKLLHVIANQLTGKESLLNNHLSMLNFADPCSRNLYNHHGS